jgi:predicted Zn-dependent peptidase
VTATQLEIATLNEIEKIVKEGITEGELQKVKNQKLMKFFRTTETINGMANTIGTYELFFGEFGKMFSAPDDYKKVTTAEIQKVAAKYFTKQNRTVGILQTEELQ